MEDHAPKCACWANKETSGPVLVDTMGNEIMGWVNDNTMILCEEGFDYALATFCAGLLILPGLRKHARSKGRDGPVSEEMVQEEAKRALALISKCLEARAGLLNKDLGRDN